jgi:hypothetical protein
LTRAVTGQIYTRSWPIVRWLPLVAANSEPSEGQPAKQPSRAKRRGRVTEMFRIWRDIVAMHQSLARRLNHEMERVPRDDVRVGKARGALDRFEDALVALREEGAGLRTLRDLLAPMEQARLSLFVETLRVIFETWDLATHPTFAGFVASRPPNTTKTLRQLAPILGVGTARLDAVLHSKEVEERLGHGAKKAAMLVAGILVDRSESTIERQLRAEHGDTKIRARLTVWPPDEDE